MKKERVRQISPAIVANALPDGWILTLEASLANEM